MGNGKKINMFTHWSAFQSSKSYFPRSLNNWYVILQILRILTSFPCFHDSLIKDISVLAVVHTHIFLYEIFAPCEQNECMMETFLFVILSAHFVSETNEKISTKFDTGGLHQNLSVGFTFGSYRSNTYLVFHEVNYLIKMRNRSKNLHIT